MKLAPNRDVLAMAALISKAKVLTMRYPDDTTYTP